MKTKDLKPGMVVAVAREGRGDKLGDYGPQKAIILGVDYWSMWRGLFGVARARPGASSAVHRGSRYERVGFPVAVSDQWADDNPFGEQKWEPGVRKPARILGTWEQHLEAIAQRVAVVAAAAERQVVEAQASKEWAAVTEARLKAVGVDKYVSEVQGQVSLSRAQLDRLLDLAEGSA